MRGDWRGVIELAEKGLEARKHSKYAVDMSIAYSNIADQELSDGQILSAIDNFRHSGSVAQQAFNDGRAAGSVHQLSEIRRRSFSEAVRIGKSAFVDPNHGLELWDVCWDAFRSYVRTPFVIQTGVQALIAWARHVTKARDSLNHHTRDKLFEKDNEIHRMLTTCKEKNWDELILRWLEGAKKEIAQLTALYASQMAD